MSDSPELAPDHQDVFAHVSHKNFNYETFVPNIPALCARIKYYGPLTPTLEVLTSLQFHFILTFPFENLSMHGLSLVPPPVEHSMLGVRQHVHIPVSVDPADVEDKILNHGRGGYCAEMTNYFALVLRTLGFQVVCKSARVLWQYPVGYSRSRTHLLAIVLIENVRYLVDVAFGGNSPPMPLRIDTEELQHCLFDTYRITSLPSPPYPRHHKFLQVRRNDAINKPIPENASEWVDMYFFDEHELSTIADWEQANFQLTLFPNGLFTTHVLIGFTTVNGRVTLFDNKFLEKRFTNGTTADASKVISKDEDGCAEKSELLTWRPFNATYEDQRCPFEIVEEIEISTRAQYVDILRNKFGLCIPEDKVSELSLPGIILK